VIAFGGEKVGMGRKLEKGMIRERKKIRKNAHLLNINKRKLKHGYNLTLLHGVTEYFSDIIDTFDNNPNIS
jgi:hypothetical protein